MSITLAVDCGSTSTKLVVIDCEAETLLAIASQVAVALGLLSAGLVLTIDGVPLTVAAQTPFKSVHIYPLMPIRCSSWPATW
jgi:sugar (pentulose or hexulose) kinase